MSYLGDFAAGDVIDFKFTTRAASTGPSTLGGTPSLEVYKSNSTAASTLVPTLTVDFAGRTGLNHVRLPSTGDATFFANGGQFSVAIAAGTVNTQPVIGEVVGRFTLRAQAVLYPATSGRQLVVDANGLADANAVKVGPSGAGTAQTARDIGASVLLSAGAGTGQLDFTAGVVKANATQFAGQTITAAAGVTIPASIASPTNITAASGVALTAAYDAAKTAAQAGDAMALTAGERTTLTAAVWAFVLTGTTTAVQAMRGFIAALLGKASGLNTGTPKYRNIADSKNVIDATTDVNGNRTAVTLDLS